MADYTKYKRGSEWRKWDLHIHTPGTKKNDQYEGSTLDNKWENFITAINSSTEEISVVGITDYLSIENYFTFKNLVQENRITNKFDLILPNVELRILPVTGSNKAVNIHCIFNPEIDLELESRFFGKLRFNNSSSSYSATKSELIRFGRDHEGNSATPEEIAYKVGIEQFVIELQILQEVFKNDPQLKENALVLVTNKSTDGTTGIIQHSDYFVNQDVSQLDATRRKIYQFSDALFSSREGDRKYFLGKGADDIKTVIAKCGSLKPCFHGSDAHKNEDLFKPIENRFCWVKADPTFEGLKQTLFEPEDRVKIQVEKPDSKNEYHVIKSVEFIDSGNLIGNQKILLNENLNAIIGGKSSGKSLLLYSIASSIDPEQVDKTSSRLGFEGYTFNTKYNFKVHWKDTDEDVLTEINYDKKSHKITYIPQLYINHLVEKNNKFELNSLISNILLQDSGFKLFFEEQKNLIAGINSEIDNLLTQYLSTRDEAINLQTEIKEGGEPTKLEKSVNDINIRIKDLQAANRFTSDELKKYDTLTTEIKDIENQQREQQKKIVVLQKIQTEIKNNSLSLFGQHGIILEITLKGKIDSLFNVYSEIPNDLKVIRQAIERDYKLLENNLEEAIKNLNLENEGKVLEKRKKALEKQLVPYNKKIENQKDLTKLLQSKINEETKYNRAKNNDIKFKSLLDDLKIIRSRISDLLKERIKKYEQIVTKVNETRHDIGNGIQLSSKLLLYKENFAFFNQVNKNNIEKNHLFFTKYFVNDFVKYDEVPDLLAQPLKVVDDKLIYSPDVYFPLRVNNTLADVLWGLVKDQFEIDFTVKYLGDNLLNMSPGKKGTVLLILFLQISSSEYPILIDQPEDNLDNRTIYDLLCTMIKKKKKERQILIVSHNANLVVATDAENIIVANQRGQNSITDESPYQFEYVNGSLEHSFTKLNKKLSLLKQQGIRQHVCDILEGGDEAFKQRERKYAIKL